jgi:drug/metabolite transporter (DMT)-like permease
MPGRPTGRPVLSRSARAHLLLLTVVMVWGATFVLVKDALADISPLLFNLLRMALATLALAAVYRRQICQLTRAHLIAGAVVGFCLALGYQFQTAGLARTTPAKSAFITGMVVVLVPLLSAIPVLRASATHGPRWNAVTGAVIAFAGIVLLTTPGNTAWAHTAWRSLFATINVGDWLTLGCAIGFALHMLALAHYAPRIPLAALAVLQLGACTIFMAVSLPVFERPFLHASVRLVVALLIAALLATAAAFTIQSWAQQFLPATHTALTLALEPVFAWLTAFLFLHERMTGRAAMGAVLILLGIAVTELLPQRPIPTAHEAGSGFSGF